MAELLEKWRALSTQNFTPLQASLELTFRCNERCQHCYIDDFRDDPDRVLSLDQWKEILDKLREAGTLYLILMGGEAMLNKHFWEILEYSSKLGFYNSMISNGLLIKDLETAKRLKDNGLHRITFSLYSLDEDIHDTLTQVRGSFRTTMRALQFCREASIIVSVNCLLTKLNIHTVYELIDWCIEENLEIREDPIVTPGFNGKTDILELRASRAQLLEYYRERARRWPHSLKKDKKSNGDDYICNVGKGKCAITPYGELLTCIDVRVSLGSLVEKSFDELWLSKEANSWRNIKVKDVEGASDCSNPCELCPAMSLTEEGDRHKLTKNDAELEFIKGQVRHEFSIE